MKFHATVILEFSAHDVSGPGERLKRAARVRGGAPIETRSLELATPPGTSVTLPSIPPDSIGAMTSRSN
jgi:hypothetical protein